MRLTPESFDVQRLLGLAFSLTHRDPACEYHLGKALAPAPLTGTLLTGLALNLPGQGRYEEAESYFQQASQLEPTNARNLVAQANSAELDRRWDKDEAGLAGSSSNQCREIGPSSGQSGRAS